MEVRRISPSDGFLREIVSQRERIRAVETRPTGNIVVRETIKSVDPETGVETILGLLPDGTYGILEFVNDIIPPAKPAPPQVEGTVNGIIVTWSGLDSLGRPQPPDYNRTEVQYSPDGGVTWAVGGQLLATATNLTIPGLGSSTTYSIRLRSYDKNNNGSEYSSIVEATPISLGDTEGLEELRQEYTESMVDLNQKISSNTAAQQQLSADLGVLSGTVIPDLNSSLSAATTRLSTAETRIQGISGDVQTVSGQVQSATQAAAQAATDAASAVGIASGKGKVLIQNTAPGAEDRNVQTLWIDTTNGANTPKKWVSGTTWIAVTDKTATDAATAAANAASAAATAKGVADTALTMAGSKSKVYYSTSNPSGTAVVGDTWRKLDAANNVIAEWRYVGGNTPWQAQQITSDVISNLDVGKLTANSGSFNEVVARNMAAATAAFQTVDIKNLTVTGTSNLDTVTAQRIAANVGSFLSLSVGQLTADNANLTTATADKIFSNLFTTRKLFANQVMIGHPGNLYPDPGFNDAAFIKRVNDNSTCTVTVSSTNDLQLNNTATGSTLQYCRPMGTPQTQAGVVDNGWISVNSGEVWTLSMTVSAWKGTTGWVQFTGRTLDGATTINVTPKVAITTASTNVVLEATIPANCRWIVPEIAVAPGISYIKRNTLVVRQKITPALIVDGLMNGKRIIGASIETNEAADTGIKLNDLGLVAYGSALAQYGDGSEVRTNVKASLDQRVSPWSSGTTDTWPGLWLEGRPTSGAYVAPAFPAGITVGDALGRSAIVRSARNSISSSYSESRFGDGEIQLVTYGEGSDMGGFFHRGTSGLGIDAGGFVLQTISPGGGVLSSISSRSGRIQIYSFGDVVINGSVVSGDSGWLNLGYVNGWTDYGLGFGGLQYRKKSGVLYIRGNIKGGAFYTAIGTLPEGFRPVVPTGTSAMEFPITVIAGGDFRSGSIFAYASGGLTYYGPNSSWTGQDRVIINAAFPL